MAILTREKGREDIDGWQWKETGKCGGSMTIRVGRRGIGSKELRTWAHVQALVVAQTMARAQRRGAGRGRGGIKTRGEERLSGSV